MAATGAGKQADNSADELQRKFRNDVLSGLAQARKAIPARWFYDRRGSELFEQITALPEYYLTRAETAILECCGGQIAEEVGRARTVVEFGAGSATKTPLLLDRIEPACYVAIDISGEFLRHSCATLVRRYPDLPIFAVEADFTRPVPLPLSVPGSDRLGFFPGSTIGNLEPGPAVDLLKVMRDTLGDGSVLLIGMDRIKDRDVLLAAYDDAAGITAEFNLNLAHRINRELQGTIPVDGLRHLVVWNDGKARVEMHLQATRNIGFEVGGRRFSMVAGETIHTENSHKYDQSSAEALLLAGGWQPARCFSDSAARFMVILATAQEAASAS